jgi:hypothetical protein
VREHRWAKTLAQTAKLPQHLLLRQRRHAQRWATHPFLVNQPEHPMPLKSQAQRKYLWATDPKLARKMEDKTPKGKRLPEKVKPKRK